MIVPAVFSCNRNLTAAKGNHFIIICNTHISLFLHLRPPNSTFFITEKKKIVKAQVDIFKLSI